MSNDPRISFFLFMSRRMQRYLRASDGGSVFSYFRSCYLLCSSCALICCFVIFGISPFLSVLHKELAVAIERFQSNYPDFAGKRVIE
jgi:hypothetical protein